MQVEHIQTILVDAGRKLARGLCLALEDVSVSEIGDFGMGIASERSHPLFAVKGILDSFTKNL